ncbi:MAG: hypothetical protein A3J29_16045 [Acidobacteria bacterium RIFCSPLOWO2_12_FULL_67_14b]|nr:MAG: hypothetical protein A3J29_16045 [Acidobacteria bacterium RIFCSPLOWO2_12_FULL_67_14b]
MDPKEISIQDLKAGLSAAIAEAESGRTLVITRHHAPVARLTPADPPSVHRGTAVGTSRLRPAIKRGTAGRYLEVLAEDRGER